MNEQEHRRRLGVGGSDPFVELLTRDPFAAQHRTLEEQHQRFLRRLTVDHAAEALRRMAQQHARFLRPAGDALAEAIGRERTAGLPA